MFKDGKWFKELVWHGKYEVVECTNHSYSWSGSMPCTGIYKCLLCGKPYEESEKEVSK